MTGDPRPNGEPEEGPIPGTTHHRGDAVMPVDGITRGRVLDVLFGGSMLTVKWLGGDVVTVQADTVRAAPTN